MSFPYAISNTGIDAWFMTKYVVIVLVFFLVLYFASQYLVSKKRQGKTKNLRVLEFLRVAPDSMVYILDVNGTKYVVAQNRNSIQLLDKFEREDDFYGSAGTGETIDNSSGFSFALERKKFDGKKLLFGRENDVDKSDEM